MSIPPHPNFGRLQLFVQGHLELAGALAATDGPRSAAAVPTRISGSARATDRMSTDGPLRTARQG